MNPARDNFIALGLAAGAFVAALLPLIPPAAKALVFAMLPAALLALARVLRAARARWGGADGFAWVALTQAGIAAFTALAFALSAAISWPESPLDFCSVEYTRDDGYHGRPAYRFSRTCGLGSAYDREVWYEVIVGGIFLGERLPFNG